MNIKKTRLDRKEWMRWWQTMEALRDSHWNGWDVSCAVVPRKIRLAGRATARGCACGILIAILLLRLPAFASGSVMLGWNPSPDPTVTGYKIYYGGSSRVYTNAIDVGNVTNATITGLKAGVVYYFAATTYDAARLESAFSVEVPYLVSSRAVLYLQIIKSNGIPVSLVITANGMVPNQWTLQSSRDLRTWTAIAQGTNLAVNVLAAINGMPVQFFRLIGQ
jgi:hypothetical protein